MAVYLATAFVPRAARVWMGGYDRVNGGLGEFDVFSMNSVRSFYFSTKSGLRGRFCQMCSTFWENFFGVSTNLDRMI